MKTIPPQIWHHEIDNNGERKVMDLLEEVNLSSYDVALHSQNVSGGNRQSWSEIDFLVITKRAIVGMEVKGGPVRYINKFWRVYAGFRVGYTIWNQSKYKDVFETIRITGISDFNNLRLGTSLSVGYNKFNLFAYYSLNPFFNENAVTTDGQKVNFHGIKLGLIFYIL